MRIVYMGTPAIAANILQALADSRHEVVLCLTQPDRPVGRKQEIKVSQAKAKAQLLGIPVFQPEKLKNDESVARLEVFVKEMKADIIVVAAYGQILPAKVLSMTKYGCVNVHASLLPAYRGAAPIQWAIIDGLDKTGISIMQMDEGLDTGDVIETEEINIAPDETADSLSGKMSAAAGPLLLRTLDKIENGTAKRMPQTGESSYAPMLTKKTGRIDWDLTSKQIDCLIRGVTPAPGATALIGGKTIKILEARRIEINPDITERPAGGTIICADREIIVACKEGALAITRLQPEGKKPMDAAAFLRGNRLKTGDKFEAFT